MTNISDIKHVPARDITVACQIGKHLLCNGTGKLTTGEDCLCDCPCHAERKARTEVGN